MRFSYGLTLSEIVDSSLLRRARLLSGARGLDRVVHGLQVIPMAGPADGLREGDLVIASNPWPERDGDVGRLLHKLTESNVSALVVEACPPKRTVPRDAVELGDRLVLPILVLPSSIPASSVVHSVAALFMKYQTAFHNLIEFRQKVFIEEVLMERGLQGVADAVARIINNPIAIEEFVTYTRVYSGAEGDKATRAGLTPYSDMFPRARLQSLLRLPSTETAKASAVCPIRIGDEVMGYVQAWVVNRPLVGLDIETLQRAALAASILISYRRSVVQAENRQKDDLLADLLWQTTLPEQTIHNRARALGVDLSRPAVAIVVGAPQLADRPDHLRRIRSFIEGRPFGSRDLVGQTGTSITILHFPEGTSPALAAKKLHDWAKRTQHTLGSDLGLERLQMGAGTVQQGIKGIRLSHMQAMRAMEVAHLVHNSSVCLYTELGALRLLSAITDPAELQDYLETTIGPVVKHDRERKTELIASLRVFVDTDGNLAEASKKLFVHPNTLKYRIRKIQELTGLDPRLGRDRLTLAMALQVMDLLAVREGRNVVGVASGPFSS